MKPISSLLAQTRWECIRGHATLMRHNERIGLPEWSEDVLKIWLERTPESARGVDFRQQGPIDVRMKVNGQKIERWLNPDKAARPSIDVEECLVLAMRQAYRLRCLSDLALRYGSMFIEIPVQGEVTLGNAADLVMELGQALTALSPLFAGDNEINASDNRENLLHARQELLDVQAQVRGLLSKIDNALDQQTAIANSEIAVSAPLGVAI